VGHPGHSTRGLNYRPIAGPTGQGSRFRAGGPSRPDCHAAREHCPGRVKAPGQGLTGRGRDPQGTGGARSPGLWGPDPKGRVRVPDLRAPSRPGAMGRLRGRLTHRAEAPRAPGRLRTRPERRGLWGGALKTASCRGRPPGARCRVGTARSFGCHVRGHLTIRRATIGGGAIWNAACLSEYAREGEPRMVLYRAPGSRGQGGRTGSRRGLEG